MFNFLKNRRLKAIQDGKIPFYCFPDKHGQSAVHSLASIVPIFLASKQAARVDVKDANKNRRDQLSLIISNSSLIVKNPKLSSGAALSFKALAVGSLENEFLIKSSNAKSLASDIHNLILTVLSNNTDYAFECYWTSDNQRSKIPAKATGDQSLESEGVASLEKKYEVTLPSFYKEFLRTLRRNESVRCGHHIDRFFTTETELIAVNDRVRETFPYCDIWKDVWFAVGSDGSGNDYFIITGTNDESVYELDHEQVCDREYDPLLSPRFESLLEVD